MNQNHDTRVTPHEFRAQVCQVYHTGSQRLVMAIRLLSEGESALDMPGEWAELDGSNLGTQQFTGLSYKKMNSQSAVPCA